jgi:hypothetical protein
LVHVSRFQTLHDLLVMIAWGCSSPGTDHSGVPSRYVPRRGSPGWPIRPVSI